MLNKKYIIAIFIIVIAVGFYLEVLRKTEIIVVDQELNFSNIAVKNFPLTENGKIAWWNENKEYLRKKYDIPKPASNGDWYVNIWDYGDGFKSKPKGDIRVFNSETQDMMCFDSNENKCIDKKMIMRVENNKDGTISIETGNDKKNIK
ncbi:DUF943 family protein [Pantoea allii]|nr:MULTISPECIES: DUF943 family protein [Pantoea]MBW1252297.1 DUF943 family protein [Pantoea allii]MBW1261576.1 DUF943 family protein [Pantoea allii]MBW1283764.1 DUF943 family protein [Pantoea allii]MDJ0088057.1 DUF943 family protein [Pantoea allii]PBJ99824.1 hypothetical protein CMR03_14140 [Pantoea allii]